MVWVAENTRGEPEWLAAVADEVRAALASASLPPDYDAALADVLAVPCGILSGTPSTRWVRTVVTCCTAVGGRWEQAVEASAAIELFMAALDVLDDEEDGDASPLRSRLGSPRLINVSTGLLLVAQRTLLAMDRGNEALAVLLPWTLRACGGQDDDLRRQATDAVSLEDALDITERKSASLAAAACQIGALCGGAGADLQARYGQFGACLGAVAQLSNDLAAIAPGTEETRDLALKRPTLPLAYAAQVSGFAERSDTETRSPWTQGAAYLTWAVAESFRQSAMHLITRLSDSTSARAELEDLVCTL